MAAKRICRARSSQIVTFAATTRGPAALLSFGRAATAAIERLDPDIVHLHSSFAGALVRTLLPRRSDRPKIVYCSHGWAFGIECAPLKQRLYAAIERRLARRSDLIIVISQAEHALAVQFGLPQDKLLVVNNGVAWQPTATRSAGGDKPRIASIGRHDRQKGLDLLLKTIARTSAPNIEFHIGRRGRPWSASASQATTAADVTFTAWLDRPAIDALLVADRCGGHAVPLAGKRSGWSRIEPCAPGFRSSPQSRRVAGHRPPRTGGYIFDLDDPDALGRLLAGLDGSRSTSCGNPPGPAGRAVSRRADELADRTGLARVLGADHPLRRPAAATAA